MMSITENNITVFTDEISRDFDTAISVLNCLGMKKIDLRNMRTGRVPYISDEEKSEIKNCISKYGCEVNTISPGIGKLKIFEEGLKAKTIKHLLDSITFADEFGVDKIIVFSFKKKNIEDREEIIPQFAVEILKEVLDIGRAHNKQILIENQSTCYVSTFNTIVDFIERISDKSIKIAWDPFNSFQVEKKQYEYDLKEFFTYIGNIHIKDAEYNGEFVRKTIGNGMVGWDKIIKQLIELGYDKEITIETHNEPYFINTIKDYAALMSMLKLENRIQIKDDKIMMPIL